MKRFLALMLVLVMLLSGCVSMADPGSDNGFYTAYENMTYTRPDPEMLEQLLARCCETARTDTDADRVMEAVYDWYDAYDRFDTDYSLAYIAYNRDVTDAYWDGEFTFCADYAYVMDAGLEELYMALADSPIREELESDYFGQGFFDAYDGESVWDDGFLALLDREGELMGDYYAICAEAEVVEYGSEAYFDQYAERLCQSLIELVLLRQELAEYMGYESYPWFAYDFYHYRDYTPEQAMAYLESVRDAMGPVYRKVNETDAWEGGYGRSREAELYRYVRDCARNMGGIVWDAFGLMDAASLYDIEYSQTKFASSFEVYLPSYQVPYVFVCPSGYTLDSLTFVHEFGHFLMDYAVPGGTWAGTDVLEVFSQGMEYLSLFYAGDNKQLARYKLADCLAIYTEQSAYACFEQLLYELPEAELTVENVFALYEKTMTDFGIEFENMGWDPRDLVTVSHFYTDPMYIISYVVSNDTAFQLYQLERQETGSGLKVFRENLDTECVELLDFAGQAGLESPFAPGRVERVAAELEQLLENGT